MDEEEQLIQRLAEIQSRPAAPMVDSDVRIARDQSKVDCYTIDPFNAHTDIISVSATLLNQLAHAVQQRGHDEVLTFLTQFADFEE